MVKGTCIISGLLPSTAHCEHAESSSGFIAQIFTAELAGASKLEKKKTFSVSPLNSLVLVKKKEFHFVGKV